MKRIDSVNNNYIKELAKLKIKKYRDIEKMFLIEGYHLINEAKNNLVEVLIVDEKDYIEGVNNILVTKDIIKKLSFSTTPQPIIGVCKYFENSLESNYQKVLLLDNLQDPGNVGTLIRCALGFGIDLVVLSKESVDIYNDKLLRASQGSVFKIKIIQEDLVKVIPTLKERNIKVYGTSLKNGINLGSVEVSDSFGLVLGNEGNGVSEDILKITDKNIFIEMDRKLESLNVGVAGAIVMHHFYMKNI